ncbi:MAG: linear amide C-N hydrolase [Anaerolineae bacterium]|nr:linear amide C-N hydrolase [Anaerolineae bacterium]
MDVAALLRWFVMLLALLAGDDPATTTLESLQQVDDYPLYTMTYYGEYVSSGDFASVPAPDVGFTSPPCEASPSPPVERGTSRPTRASDSPLHVWRGAGGEVLDSAVPAWGCSLFAAYADTESAHFGRNFDWQFSPALLLFTDPPDGYASVSMVDLAYFGFGSKVNDLTTLSLEARAPLLDTWSMPFDGMNEHGLTVGMAAVPGTDMPRDPDKETLGSLEVIRAMLDQARDVDEALAVMADYNIDMRGGPAIHYLIADASGRSVLVEFYRGEMVTISNQGDWQAATNFLLSSVEDPADGDCWRYDKLSARLAELEGAVTPGDAMAMLESVSQPGDSSTQWSVVYGIATGDIYIAMGQDYDAVHVFNLPRARAPVPERPPCGCETSF